ncbi:hypothetical protein [Pseudooceanicola onchidii]|uniref:hypothetical protein n=1 Tax=Pseudooceanicola onchidii TaxID=2562279 RepID=UPI0010AA67DE|nr:hypothetical protein [Pseudooceanicola onchidii]
MTLLTDQFPARILDAAPAPRRCYEAVDYLDHLLDERPDLFSAAVPFAGHEDLAELVMTRLWSRSRTADLQALAEIAEHPETDFWVGFAILLRVFPDPTSAPALVTLAARIVARINSGTWRLQHSVTPIISTRGLELYARLSENRPDLRLTDEAIARAEAHAAWLERGRKATPRYTTFNGTPIWAANTSDTD